MFYVLGGGAEISHFSSPLENNGDSTSKLIIREIT